MVSNMTLENQRVAELAPLAIRQVSTGTRERAVTHDLKDIVDRLSRRLRCVDSTPVASLAIYPRLVDSAKASQVDFKWCSLNLSLGDAHDGDVQPQTFRTCEKLPGWQDVGIQSDLLHGLNSAAV